jgi:hypothetical protein
MKWIKYLLLLATVGVIGAVLGYVFVYNKPHPDYLKKKPDLELTAAELFKAFRTDEVKAGKTYNGKMLAVSGFLDDVEKVGDQMIAFFILDDGLFGREGVRITMLQEQEDALFDKVGMQSTIKGFCAGFNEPDVVLLHGSVVR